MSLHLLFGRPGNLVPADILSLEILIDLSASNLVTYSSHSLLLPSTHSLIGWILQDSLICWLLILLSLALVILILFHYKILSQNSRTWSHILSSIFICGCLFLYFSSYTSFIYREKWKLDTKEKVDFRASLNK